MTTTPSTRAHGSARARQAWQTLSPRERVALVVAATAVGTALLLGLGVRPAWTTLQQGPQKLARLDADLQRVQQAALEAQALRQQAPVAPADARAALKAATERLGAQAQLSPQGEQTLVTLQGVDAQALSTWLGEVRRAARMAPIAVQLQRQDERYAGTVLLAGGGDAP